MTAADRLSVAIEAAQRQLANGERPLFHVLWAAAAGGAIDVTVAEFPLIHLFVPDHAAIPDGARMLIARTLMADPGSFDVTRPEG